MVKALESGQLAGYAGDVWRWTTLASLELRELVQSLVQQIQIGDAQISV